MDAEGLRWETQERRITDGRRKSGGSLMVEPMSREERDSGNRKIQIGFLLLVAVSPPLMLLLGDPTLLQLAAAVGAGLVLGVVLLWYLRGLAAEFTPGPRR